MLDDKTIMLVEDNPDDEALTIRAFRKNNVQSKVVVAHDGAEALDYLFAEGAYAGRNSAELPSVVLLDLNLPKFGGLEVLRRIREDERTKTLPVVILTSSKEDRDVLSGYHFGANSYVRKPVNFDEFVEAARSIGVYWLLFNQSAPR